MANKEITQEIERLKKDLSRLTNLAGDQISEQWNGVGQLSDQAKQYWAENSGKVKDRLDGAVETAKTKAREVGQQTDEYAHERPWQVAGMAAAVGFMAALLMSHKRQR